MNKKEANDYYVLRIEIERKSHHLFSIHILMRSRVDFYCHILYVNNVNTKKKGNNEK